MATKTKPEVRIDVKPREIASAFVYESFDKAKEALESEGHRVISLAENARLRIQEGANSQVSDYGNWTREGVIYVPKKDRFLSKISPIMANAKEATACHRKGEDYYLTGEQVEEALSDSVELSEEVIPTNRFADNEITVYAFDGEEQARQYGEFLRDNGIKEMPVWLVDLQDKPFARQMWFRGLDDRSSLLGGYLRNLDCSDRVRGVCESAEGTPQKSEAYTPKQLEKALKGLGFPEVTKGLIDKLKSQ